MYVQIQILHYIHLQFLLYFLLHQEMLKNNCSFLLEILHIIRLCQISFCLHHSYVFQFEYIIRFHDCMHLLFLNNVHHLLQLMVYLIFLLIVLTFDLQGLVLLSHYFEVLYNNLLQILFYAIKLFLLLFHFDHLITLDLPLQPNKHLGI